MIGAFSAGIGPVSGAAMRGAGATRGSCAGLSLGVTGGAMRGAGATRGSWAELALDSVVLGATLGSVVGATPGSAGGGALTGTMALASGDQT